MSELVECWLEFDQNSSQHFFLFRASTSGINIVLQVQASNMADFYNEENYDFKSEPEEERLHEIQINLPQNTVGKNKKWSEHEVDTFIDLYREKTCLWDMSHREYFMRTKREEALQDIEQKIGRNVIELKGKITCLRSQLGREIAKVKSRRTEPGNEDYTPQWIYWEKLQFLTRFMHAANKNKQANQSLSDDFTASEKNINEMSDDSADTSYDQDSLTETPYRQVNPRKRKALNEDVKRRPEILTPVSVTQVPVTQVQREPVTLVLREPVTQVLGEPVTQMKREPTTQVHMEPVRQFIRETVPQSNTKSQCAFSLYVAERLRNFDRRTRMIAEKRINDILFELEMSNEDHEFQQNWQATESSQATNGIGHMNTSSE